MSYYEPKIFPRFRDYAPSIAIPSVYWDVESAEQRVRAICEILGRVVSYADEMGIEVTNISQILADIEAGKLDPMIVEAIETWFAENEPDIIERISLIEEKLPIDAFNIDGDTVARHLDMLVATDDRQDIAINRNATNISSVQSDITALNARVTTINNSLTSLTSRVGTVESVLSTKRYIACCGDSFGNDTDNEWPGMVATRFGYACLNKCTNGAAFTKTNNSIQMQLEAIENSSQAANGLIDYIIIYAGVNDWNDQSATTEQVSAAIGNCQTVINRIQAAAPINRQPKVIFAFGNMGYGRRDQYIGYPAWVDRCVRRAASNNRMQGLVKGVPYWLWDANWNNVWESDYLHPNAAGERIIASRIGQCIMGTYSGIEFYASTNVISHGSGNVQAYFNNGLTCVEGNLNNMSIPLANEWTQIAALNNYTFAPGSGNTTSNFETGLIYSPIHQMFVYNNQVGITRFAFNPRLGSVWFQRFGSVEAIQQAGGYGANWTGSPEFAISSAMAMSIPNGLL